MNSIKKLFIMGLWLLFSLALSADQGICGRVTGPDGTGLEGAAVNIFYRNEGLSYVTMKKTDMAGNYCVSLAPAGGNYYIVGFYHPDFLYQYYNDKVLVDNASGIGVKPGQFIQGIDARLKAGGKISGRVIGPDGQGLQTNVLFFHNEDNFWKESTTDHTGIYTSPPLREGKYRVFFEPVDKLYLPECFNNRKPDNGIMDLVSVIDNQITSGIDAQLEKCGSISGRVFARNLDNSFRYPPINVALYNAETDDFSEESTDEKGYFRFSNLYPGNYLLYFSTYDHKYFPTWYRNHNVEEQADKIKVTAGETTVVSDTILVEKDLNSTISGRVIDADGLPFSNVIVDVFDSKTYTWVASGDTGLDGKYSISKLPPGEYALYFRTWDYYIPEWYNNKTSWRSADKIVVGHASTIQADTVKLEMGGILQGIITNPQGERISDVWVTVYDSINGDLVEYAEIYSDEAMSFHIYKLPTGKYKLNYHFKYETWDQSGSDSYADGWYSRKKTKSTADDIFVQAGSETEPIDVQVDYGGAISGALSIEGDYYNSNYVQISCFDLETGILMGQTFGYIGSDYELLGLPAGNYKVFFNPSDRANCSSEWYNDKSSMETADIVSVRAREITYGIDARFSLSGSISGQVKTSGELKFATIKIFAIDANSGQIVKETIANSNGVYTISGLQEGNYLVNFRLVVRNNDNSISEWYKGKSFQNFADLVPVTLGRTTEGIDAVLNPHSSRVEKRHVRGRE